MNEEYYERKRAKTAKGSEYNVETKVKQNIFWIRSAKNRTHLPRKSIGTLLTVTVYICHRNS